MIECCSNCKHYREILKYRSTEDGYFIAAEKGYACMTQSDDGRVIHVIDIDTDSVHCEEWSRKSL